MALSSEITTIKYIYLKDKLMCSAISTVTALEGMSGSEF